MSKSFRKNLTGLRFGRLTVLEFVPTEDRHSHWLCKCDCGNEKTIDAQKLLSFSTKSCGCWKIEKIVKHSTKHNGKGTRLYEIWKNMKQRCLNTHNPHYQDYGGRGIKMCNEWLGDFSTFRDWAFANGYSDDLSIDRIDNNGNYKPTNCRWTDRKNQCNNRRSNIFVVFNNKQITISEASQLTGIHKSTLKDRYRRGDRGERLFRPVKK